MSDSKFTQKTQKHKKCKQNCKSTDVITDTINASDCTKLIINCCTLQYSRLYGFLTSIMSYYAYGSWSSASNAYWAYDRSGIAIPPPNTLSATSNSNFTHLVNLNGAYYTTYSGCTGSDPYGATNLSNTSSNTNTNVEVAYLSYYFVNQFAYGPYEPGCKSNQVWGWFVDLSQGQLQLYSIFNNVSTNVTRRCLINQPILTHTQKSQLKTLNILYKMTKCAVKQINGIPAEEGNILEINDCKGNNWLLYINTAGPVGVTYDTDSEQPDNNVQTALSSNTQFTVVACKL